MSASPSLEQAIRARFGVGGTVVGLGMLATIFGANLLGWVLDLTPPPWVALWGDPAILKRDWENPAIGYVVTLLLLGLVLNAVVSWRRRRRTKQSLLPAFLAIAVVAVAFAGALAAPLGKRDVAAVVAPGADEAPATPAPGDPIMMH